MQKNITNGVEGIKIVVINFSKIIAFEREILNLAGEANDVGIVSFRSVYITQTEKTL